MSAQLVYELIIAWLPSLIAVGTALGVVIKVCKEFVALKKQVVDMKELTDAKAQMGQILKENYELKKTMNELLTKIDRVDRSKK